MHAKAIVALHIRQEGTINIGLSATKKILNKNQREIKRSYRD